MKILVLDVGGTAIKSAIIDDSDQLSQLRVTPSSADGPQGRIQKAIEIAHGYDDFDVVSVAMCGQIDDNTREVLFRYGEPLGSPPFPAGELLARGIGRPVYLLNDCNAAALGEAYFGAGRGQDSFLCLTYGTGVGGGIVQDGRLYTGSRGIAAEFGHIVTHKGGRLCGCGRRGCYEQYASTTALLRAAKRRYPHLENAKALFALAPTEPDLQRIIRAWIDEIVAGLLTLTYIFNPSCILLGGGVMEQESLAEQIRRRFAQSVIPTFSGLALRSAQLGNQAGMFGAAVYARQRLAQTKKTK